MDTLAIIRDKAERLAQLLPKSGIMFVVRHIELAERHFDVARRDAESDLFVDVVYRIALYTTLPALVIYDSE